MFVLWNSLLFFLFFFMGVATPRGVWDLIP